MRIAIDPMTRAEITPDDYLSRYGNKPLGANTDPRPRVRCGFCDQAMHLVAGRTEDTVGHFAHLPKSGFCPTKAPSALPYGRLKPRSPDPEGAKRIRQVAMDNWRWVYAEIKERVPVFEPTEFIALIQEADKDGLWGYRNLTLQQVPELFMVSRDFTPATSRGRRYWIRFWFSGNIQSIDDLWIQRPETVTLHRASFPPPKGRQKIPDPMKMIAKKNIDRVGAPHDAQIQIDERDFKMICERLKVK